NARVAREYLVALPVELSPLQRLSLVRGFSRELVDRYGFAIDFAIHAPRDFPGNDPRNFHAHLLTTTREVTSQGLGAKTMLDRSNDNRVKLGMKSVVHELLHVRERWAIVTNEALRQAHISARIDHRSLAAQGLDVEPQPHIPRAAFEMERHGYRSKAAERLREQYEVRVQARLARTASRQIGRDQSSAAEPAAKPTPAKPQSLEDIRREARENWLRLRQGKTQDPAESAPSATARISRDDDLAR
ncbi:MAG: MobA/MobL family protein, partial [Gammaproteobacteria bacterium]